MYDAQSVTRKSLTLIAQQGLLSIHFFSQIQEMFKDSTFFSIVKRQD